MGLVVTKYPEVNVGNEVSKWQAAHLPINYEVQRADQQVLNFYKPSSAVVALVMDGPIEPGVTIGDTIQYVASNGTSYTWIIDVILGNQIFVTSLVIGPFTGGHVNYVNSRSNYRIRVEVLGIDTSQTYVSLGFQEYRTDTEGKVRINTAKYLQSFATSNGAYLDSFAYDVINKAITGEGGKYAVNFFEIYDEQTGDPEQTLSEIRYWTNSSKQVGEIYGSNMGEYCPTNEAARDPKAKFLSVFEKPTYFVGYPFSLSFIWSDNMKNLQLKRQEEQFDLNGNSIATSEDELNPSSRFFVNRLTLKGDYPTTASEIDVWLNYDGVIESNELSGGKGETGDLTTGDLFNPYGEFEAPVKPAIITK